MADTTFLDTFARMFGQDAPQVSPDGRALNPGVMQYLAQQNLLPQQRSPEQDSGRRVSRGLQAFSEALLNPKVDFLPALAGGLSAGAGAYLDTGDQNFDDRNKTGSAQLAAALGITKGIEDDQAKADALTLRESTLAQRERAADDKLAYLKDKFGWDQSQDIWERGYKTDKLNTDIKKADRIGDQNDRRLDQNDTRQKQSYEVNRDRIDISREGNRIQRDRLNATIKKAEADATAIQKRFDLGEQGKADRADANLRVDVEKLKNEHAKTLGLDDPMFKVVDPAGYDAALKDMETYSATIMQKIGWGGQQATRSEATPQPIAPIEQPKAAPAPAPAATAPTDIGGSKVVKSVNKGGVMYFLTEDGKVHKAKAPAATANQ